VIVCVVDRDGVVRENRLGENVSIAKGDDGWLSIDVIFPSGTGVFALGLSKVDPIEHFYEGSGSVSCEIRRLSLETLPFDAGDDRIAFVDVGARYGLPAPWVWKGSTILPVMFEPEPKSAMHLREYVKNFPGGKLIEAGLYNKTGARTLYVTHVPGCSSLRPPNPDYAAHNTDPFIFDVVGTETIEVTTYAALFRDGLVPRPDVIKIDVQGCEYEVLEGFGDLLSDCLGIELETHISPLYHGQKLLTDIVALLDRFDFDLIELRKAGSYDRLLEFDVQFIKSPSWWGRQPVRLEAKHKILRDVWQLR
jgi:FkbM family methyltransferase